MQRRQPRPNSAWRLIREASFAGTDETLFSATGTLPDELAQMRQHWRDMREMGLKPTGQWDIDRECFPEGRPIYRRD